MCVAPRPLHEYEYGKKNTLFPIRANSFVSIIMYLTYKKNSFVEITGGMAYMLTLLMFRKPK
jgi:hypothetical protein